MTPLPTMPTQSFIDKQQISFCTLIPFQDNVQFLYDLKLSENLFYDFFRSYISKIEFSIKKGYGRKGMYMLSYQLPFSIICILRSSIVMYQGFNQPLQVLYVIFPTESDFSIRSRYPFYFMFSLTFKAFVTFVTFLLFQCNLYVVLGLGKCPKNRIHRDLFKTKKSRNPKLLKKENL